MLFNTKAYKPLKLMRTTGTGIQKFLFLCILEKYKINFVLKILSKM
jgi:hypothetical protein